MFSLIETLETQEDKNKAFLLYDCFKNHLYTVAYSLLKDESSAEDMVHETYEVLFQCLDKFDREIYVFLQEYQIAKQQQHSLTLENFSKKQGNSIYTKALSYAVTTLRHRIYDHFEKSKKILPFPVEDYLENTADPIAMTPESFYLQEERKHMLISMIQCLSFPYKDALYLYYYHNYSTEMIAQILERKPDNIRQIISRGKKMLREQLTKEGYFYVGRTI